jgi:hypothetical protein
VLPGSALVAALVLLALTSGRAAAEDCPKVYMLESSNGHDYVAVFSSSRPQSASFELTVYTRRRAYAFALDDVAIDKPTNEAGRPYRSAPTLVENPDGAPLVADDVDVKPADGSVCPTRNGEIPTVDAVVKPRGPRSPETVATLREIVVETAAVTTVVTPTPRADIVLPDCAEPFAEARALHVVVPAYPPIAVSQRAAGTALVKVTLGDTGDVNAAALQSARATTYTPKVSCAGRPAAIIFLPPSLPRISPRQPLARASRLVTR